MTQRLGRILFRRHRGSAGGDMVDEIVVADACTAKKICAMPRCRTFARRRNGFVRFRTIFFY